MPEGYDTIIEERGANLSGDQRQRIAIARAGKERLPTSRGIDGEAGEEVITRAVFPIRIGTAIGAFGRGGDVQ